MFLCVFIPAAFGELWFDPGWNQRSYWWMRDKVMLLTDRHEHNAERRSPPYSLCDCVIVWCRCVWTPSVSERICRTSDEVEEPDCSFAWNILLLLMVLEAGTFIVSLLTNAFFKLSLIFNTPIIKFFNFNYILIETSAFTLYLMLLNAVLLFADTTPIWETCCPNQAKIQWNVYWNT